MYNTTENKKREEFKQILFKLAESQQLLQNSSDRRNIYLALEKLYSSSDNDKPFRHYYSDILFVIISIRRDDSKGNLNFLSENIEYIRQHYYPINRDNKTNQIIDISDQIRKLSDHILLDVTRISYSDGNDIEISNANNIAKLNEDLNILQQQMNYYSHTIDEAQSRSEEISSKADKLEEELSSAKTHYIEILGIFSGIVLAFVGGLVFSSSVLENIHQSSIYRLIIVICFIAALVLNSLFISFRAIEKISIKSLPLPKKSAWIATNIIILAIIIFTSFAWYSGLVERRNNQVQNNETHISETQ